MSKVAMTVNINIYLERMKRRMLAALGSVLALAAALFPHTAPAGEPAPTASPEHRVSAQGRVIVKYRTGATALRAKAYSAQTGPRHAAALGQRLGLTLHDGRALSERSQVLIAPGMSSADLAQAVARHPDIEWVAQDRRRHVRAVPGDPLFASGQSFTTPLVGQWALRSPDGYFVSAINAQAAWDRNKGSANLVVAVLDTGVRKDHPDLVGKLVPGYDFVGFSAPAGGYSTVDALAFANDGDLADADASDPGDWVTATEASSPRFAGCDVVNSSWHGTQVAGLIGASTDNAIGMAGAGWNTKVLPVRVLGKCGGFDSEIIAGMKWAAGLDVPGLPRNPIPARILNLSLGGEGACGAAYTDAIAQITAINGVVVAAAGNEGLAVGAPANCAGVVSVGGLSHVGTKVGYSNLGPEVTVSAPAGNCGPSAGYCLYPLITTTNTGSSVPANHGYSNGTQYTVGTSFAAPLVSATVALMFSANSAASTEQIISALKSSAREFPRSGTDVGLTNCQVPTGTTPAVECYCTTGTCGAGMLDAAAAVAEVEGSGPKPAFAASPTPPAVGIDVLLDGRISTAAADRQPLTYQWAITSGETLASLKGPTNAVAVLLHPLSTGKVTVQLTVTDSLGYSSAVAETFTIVRAPGSTDDFESQGGGGIGAIWLLLIALTALSLGRRHERPRH